MGENKWACRRQGNFGVRGAVKGTKEDVLAWMKRHFAGLRPCDAERRVIPAWIALYRGEAMIFETAESEEVYSWRTLEPITRRRRLKSSRR